MYIRFLLRFMPFLASQFMFWVLRIKKNFTFLKIYFLFIIFTYLSKLQSVTVYNLENAKFIEVAALLCVFHSFAKTKSKLVSSRDMNHKKLLFLQKIQIFAIISFPIAFDLSAFYFSLHLKALDYTHKTHVNHRSVGKI